MGCLFVLLYLGFMVLVMMPPLLFINNFSFLTSAYKYLSY